MLLKVTGKYLDRARLTLGDKVVAGETNRWDSEDLLTFLNEGIEFIASTTMLFKESKIVSVSDFVADYDYTDFAYEITRAEYTPKGPLSFISRQELDRLKGKSWLTANGTPTHLIFDKSDVGKFRLYPTPDDEQFESAPIETDNLPGGIYGLSDNGIVTSIDDLLSEVPPQLEFDVPLEFGINTVGSAILITPHELKLFYRAKKPVYAHGDEVDIDSRLFKPLVHYIVSEALAIGIDSENRDLAAKYYNRFIAKLDMLNIEAANSGGTSTDTTPYNNGFNLDMEPRGAIL